MGPRPDMSITSVPASIFRHLESSIRWPEMSRSTVPAAEPSMPAMEVRMVAAIRPERTLSVVIRSRHAGKSLAAAKAGTLLKPCGNAGNPCPVRQRG